MFYLPYRHPGGHFIMFYLPSGYPGGHFTMFYLPSGYPGGHFIGLSEPDVSVFTSFS